MVEWSRLFNGAVIPIPYQINEANYNTIIPNITFEDSGTYFCTVTSTIFRFNLAGRINGPNNMLTVTRQHVPPMFSSDLLYERTVNEDYMFKINAKGTAPLAFQWFVNGKSVQESDDLEVTPSNANQVTEKQSRITVDISSDEWEETTNITVIVHNTNRANQLFSSSTTIFIFKPDVDSEETESPMITEHPFSSKDCILKELIYIPTFAVGGFLLVLSWLLIAILVIANSCTRYNKRNEKIDCCLERPTNIYSADLHRDLTNGGENRQQPPVPPPPMRNTSTPSHYEQVPMPEGNGLMMRQISTALDSVTSQFPRQLDNQYANPVLLILDQVSGLYKNVTLNECSDCKLMTILHDLLQKVCNDKDIIKNNETLEIIRRMRDEMQCFMDKLNDEQRRQGSSTINHSQVSSAEEEVDFGGESLPLSGTTFCDICDLLNEWVENEEKEIIYCKPSHPPQECEH